jgi:site-specific DNA-methyltransferase (adenine-specific)
MAWTIHDGDCLHVMRGMADNSVDAIVTDPPYFKVKGDAWDRQWDKPTQFLAWLDTIAEQWQRLLKPNGSLYCFASPRMAARVECQMAERFNVLNRICWAKGGGNAKSGGWWAQQSKETMRTFFPESEYIVKGEAGYVNKCDELRGFVFEPLRAYLDSERQRACVTPRQVNEYTKTQMAGHWFTRVQWALPTATHYSAIRDLFDSTGGQYLRREYEDLRREYEDLRREYEDLRREYEDLRRPFSVTADVPYTDVWTFPTVQHYKGKHPCEKPLAMMEHIIRASTRPGAVVLDCFAGSGATGEACISLGREFVGIEKDQAYADKARLRLRAVSSPAGQLF